MLRVSAGEFDMGCTVGRDDTCSDKERPQHRVYLDAYAIDETEVTVAAYRQCVEAGGCSTDGIEIQDDLGGHQAACNWPLKGRDDHPINCVSWEQAERFCGWASKRLPTEAEWEKAARGTDRRIYPWGDEEVTEQRAVILRLQAPAARPSEGVNATQPVGSKLAGRSPYGALDMVGNVWEWTADRYDPQYYAASPARNPTGPSVGTQRVIRGDVDPVRMHVTQRNAVAPSTRMGVLGFRCVEAGN